MATVEPAASSPVWSPETRTWVSLLLFIHLFAVFVGVTTYTRPSPLQEQLHDLFAPYLRNLDMAAFPFSYPVGRYYLTHALPSDVDYTCIVEIEGSGDEVQKVTIPEPGLMPGIRARRYQNLANTTGTLAEAEANDEFNSILPRAIAGAELKLHDAKQGLFRCRAHIPPEMETLDQPGTNRTAAWETYRDVYEAQVFASAGGVDLLKKSATLEVAPVEGKSKRSTPSRGPGTP